MFIDKDFSEFWNAFDKLEKVNKPQIIKNNLIQILYDFIYENYEGKLDLKIEKFIRQKNKKISHNKGRIFFKK